MPKAKIHAFRLSEENYQEFKKILKTLGCNNINTFAKKVIDKELLIIDNPLSKG